MNANAMPLPFEEFQGRITAGFQDFPDSGLLQQNWSREKSFHVGSGSSAEPTSVLSPNSSTMSSSLGCNSSGRGGSAETAALGAGGSGGGLGGMEEWESVLSESNHQEDSIMRLIMGDVEDPSLGLNNIFQSGSNEGFLDQSFSLEQGQQQALTGGNLVSSVDSSCLPISTSADFSLGASQNVDNDDSGTASRFNFIQNLNPVISSSSGSLLPVSMPSGVVNQLGVGSVNERPIGFNPLGMVNQNQAQFPQNQPLFLPLLNSQFQGSDVFMPPPPKRLNSGGAGTSYQVPGVPFLNTGVIGQDMFLRQNQHQQQQVPILRSHLQQRPTTMGMQAKQRTMNMSGIELANNELIVSELSKAAEFIETGNLVHAHEILARLNHQLIPNGKAFHRAALCFKEALQSLLPLKNKKSSALCRADVLFKIGAYKSFSEVSPVVPFANLTCIQAVIEALELFDRIHIIDFDVGYGTQWSSLMQDLALRKGGAPVLKITSVVSSLSHGQLEIEFTREALKHFASELNMPLELEIVNIESFNLACWPLPLCVSEGEAIAVNLPVASFTNYPLPLPMVLKFVKRLRPKILVSLDRGSEIAAFRFSDYITQTLQDYSTLLESLDALNVNQDVLQKLEKFLLQPRIEKLVLVRSQHPEKNPPWRSIFISAGFSPLTFSNIAESQAECLLQRNPVRGFQIKKRESSLALSWQGKELIGVSAWKC